MRVWRIRRFPISEIYPPTSGKTIPRIILPSTYHLRVYSRLDPKPCLLTSHPFSATPMDARYPTRRRLENHRLPRRVVKASNTSVRNSRMLYRTYSTAYAPLYTPPRALAALPRRLAREWTSYIVRHKSSPSVSSETG